MCMSPSSLGNCTIYSTWCIMICLVILILSLLLFIQSLYSLSKLQIYLSLVLFLLLLVITLDIEHLNTYHYNILLGLVNIRSKELIKQLYFPGAKPIQLHCSTACASTSSCTDTCTLTWLVRTDDIRTERVNEEILPGRKHFYATNSAAQVLMCIDFAAMTCIVGLICISELKGFSVSSREKAY